MIKKRDVMALMKQAGIFKGFSWMEERTMDQETLKYLKEKSERVIDQDRQARRDKALGVKRDEA